MSFRLLLCALIPCIASMANSEAEFRSFGPDLHGPLLFPKNFKVARSVEKFKAPGITSDLVNAAKQPLGTVSRICLDVESYRRDRPWRDEAADAAALSRWRNAPPGKRWYVSVGHVSEKAQPVFIAAEKTGAPPVPLKLEFMNSDQEIAVFSADGAPGEPCRGGVLADELKLPDVYNIHAAANIPAVGIEVEANGGKTQLRLLSPVAKGVQKGVPGRDQFTAVHVMGLSEPGNSGGAVLAQPDAQGWLKEPKAADFTMASSPYRRIIGFIDTAERRPGATVLVPGPLVASYLEGCFNRPGTCSTRVTAKRTDCGTEYVDSGVIHYRTWYRVEAGYADAGPGGGGDSGFADAGPGGGGDSGNLGAAKRAKCPAHAGLQVGARRYISWGDRWTELDSLDPDLRGALDKKNQPEGIYVEQGQMFASHRDTPLPAWLPSYGNDLNKGEYDTAFSLNDRLYRKISDLSDPLSKACTLTVGLARESKRDQANAVHIVHCEEEKNGTRSFWTSILPARSSVPSMTIVGTATKQCAQSPCKVQTRFRVIREPAPLKVAPDLLKQAWAYFHRLKDSQGEALDNEGLRYLHRPGLSVILSRREGYEIDLQDGKRRFTIDGPMPVSVGLQAVTLDTGLGSREH